MPFPQAALEGLGVSSIRLSVLRACLQHGGVGISELAEQLELPVSTTRKHLTALERTGVVTVHRFRPDGRRWCYRWSGSREAVARMIDDLDVYLSEVEMLPFVADTPGVS